MNHLWGIDLGGTKIEGVVLDIQDESTGEFEILSRQRIATEQEKGYSTIVSNIERLIQLLSQETGLTPSQIGFGTPGSIDPITGNLRNSNTQCLNGKPLKNDLESLLKTPIQIANDANCFALAEALLGAGQGSSSVFGVIMGTGVGGGVVLDGKSISGLNGIAGEWGHNVLDPEGSPCYCGKSGCVETILSGPALERYYESLCGKKLKLQAIVETCTSDKAAAATVDRLTDYFGRALAVIINVFDPEMIVLGGGVSNIDSLYSEGVKRLQPNIFHDSPKINVIKNKLGDSAGVFGAALLTSQKSFLQS